MAAATWEYLGGTESDPIPDEWVWERLRNRRNALLAACDFQVLPDAPGDIEAWKTYRQSLRDLPSKTKDPRSAKWPTEPSSA
jgi:hypothetical protein